MNPLLQNNNIPMGVFDNSQRQQLKSIYSMLQNKDPRQLLSSLAKNNPALSPILQSLNNGNSLQSIAVNLMQSRGIDINQFMGELNNIISK